MYGIMMGNVYSSFSRTGLDSTNGRGPIRPFWVHMCFFSLCKIRKLLLISNRFTCQTSVVCVLFILQFVLPAYVFHTRQFPFRNQRALWKLYKSVDKAEIGSQLKPVPTLRHHVSVKLSFNEKFFLYFRIFSISTKGLDRLPKSYYDSVKLLLRSETGFIVIVRPKHQGLELDKLPVDWGLGPSPDILRQPNTNWHISLQ